MRRFPCASGPELNDQGNRGLYPGVPYEAVNYVSAHDNQDLFDTISKG